MTRAQFWAPEFRVEKRDDGTILMEHPGQAERLADTIPARLKYWADTTPEATYLAQRADGGDWRRLSYGQVHERVRSLGAALLDLGLSQDRPVLILSENSLDHAILALAAQYVGVPSAAVSTAFSLVSETHDKLIGVAELLRPGLIFASDGARYAKAIDAIRTPDTKVAASAPTGDMMDIAGLTGDPAKADAAFDALTGDMVAKYLFTSGSTGSPKAVINTHDMLARNQDMVADCFRFLRDHPPVVVDWAPWSHTASGNKVFNMVLCNGGSYYIDEGKPTPHLIGETLRNLHEISPTWYFNVPAGYEMLLDEFRKDRALAEKFFAQLDMMMYAGAGMAQHIWDGLLQMARDVAGHDVLLTTALGATETGPFALMCTEQQDAPGNVGVPARGITLKLVPNEDKLEARLKSPSITQGYYQDAKTTAEHFDEEGFYLLGDALRPADPDDLTKGFFFDGRIAENFKLATGTWVAVGALRARLVDHFEGLIRDAVIVGENREELGALVFPAEGVTDADLPALQNKLDSFAAAATGSSNRVRRMVVLTAPPDLDKGEATDKGSINQRAVIRERPAAVEQLYQAPRGVSFL
ncbi:feruloyl-CoA synthase [Thalassovita mangrovi]|uniref:AMP-binding protein n=1 Tax=Thalassovita mangrovi TaxID=2692236 RepID=A0A6L8LM15_9RHOB|nr:feruloyl-CoA synthase [Thalassovita mangrovi]MYM57091.1 AMP-binding protein [Thalassovita mangrovi]